MCALPPERQQTTPRLPGWGSSPQPAAAGTRRAPDRIRCVGYGCGYTIRYTTRCHGGPWLGLAWCGATWRSMAWRSMAGQGMSQLALHLANHMGWARGAQASCGMHQQAPLPRAQLTCTSHRRSSEPSRCGCLPRCRGCSREPRQAGHTSRAGHEAWYDLRAGWCRPCCPACMHDRLSLLMAWLAALVAAVATMTWQWQLPHGMASRSRHGWMRP